VPTVLLVGLLITLLFPAVGAYPLFGLLIADNLIDKTWFSWRARRKQAG
jgi:hypothetical protein